MKLCAISICLWAMSQTLFSEASAGKAEQEWEIKTRTLGHAGDGSPDSRAEVGIGEWVELKVVPETISNVEWVIKGDSIVTNRFGNPTILIVGYTAGSNSLSAIVHDEPQAATPDPKESAANDKWRRLEAELKVLGKSADKPADFESRCERILKEIGFPAERSALQATDMECFIRLVGEMDRLSPGFPDSYSWATLRGSVAEAAAMRLGTCLDSTAIKSKLGVDFWKLLRACATNLASLDKQFEAAGGEANSTARVFSGSPPFEGYNPRLGRNAVANALSNRLSTLPFLLYVQIRNALPGASVEKLKEVLLEHGLSEDEITRILTTAK